MSEAAKKTLDSSDGVARLLAERLRNSAVQRYLAAVRACRSARRRGARRGARPAPAAGSPAAAGPTRPRR